MAIVLEGVVASREAGALMPFLSMDRASISNCCMNAFKIDNGDMVVPRPEAPSLLDLTPILPNPNNLPMEHSGLWNLETELYANFNGDLEAGPITFYGNEIDGFAIRRSSNRTNFSVWDDIKIVAIDPSYDNVNPDKMTTVTDKTVESGVWYIYASQPMSKGERGVLNKAKKQAIITEDAFLLGSNGKQLKLRFDTSVSSIKKNIKESRVETLGSKYPFITRNGAIEYREFALTGLITHFMDETKDFAPRADLFVDNEFQENVFDLTSDYDALYRANDIDDYNNDTLEREFRRKVEEFLLDGQPKLFKSPKLGNILVRLMDVNLSPREDIKGGMVSTFSCNAIEIDEATVENLDKYNIQKRGE